MRIACNDAIVPIPEEERARHKKATDMRYDGASYQEISEATGIETQALGWYISTDPNRQWTLDDWIADYYYKDSSVFQKVDAIIDCDERIVERFKRRGITGSVIKPLT